MPRADGEQADKALVERRVEDVLRIRLDGAEFWDVREFVRAKEKEPGSNWELPAGGTPLSDGQLRRYQQKADRLVQESFERGRKKHIRQHLAKRRMLYGRAVNAGELATALAILKDEATLLRLYPATKHEHAGKGGGPIVLTQLNYAEPPPKGKAEDDADGDDGGAGL